jgi:DoxX-like family
LFFLASAILKLLAQKKNCKKMFSANTPVLVFTTRLLGFLEVLGAVGIILPLLLNIYPFLTAVAGLCLSTVMVGAAILHLQKKEYKALPLVAVLFIFSVLIAVNRY